MNVLGFFAPGERVVALPHWRDPQLVLSARGLAQRWTSSRLFPAFRATARLYRTLLRVKVTCGAGGSARVGGGAPELREIVLDTFPTTSRLAVRIGSHGPARKATIQAWDGEGRTLGYLKFGETRPARDRIAHEFRILEALPAGLGPRPLRYEACAHGTALAVAPLPGALVAPSAPPPAEVATFCRMLLSPDTHGADRHPGVARWRSLGAPEPWLDALSARRWPVATVHGDLAWNLMAAPSRAPAAIDWEYGSMRGFPFVDLATYSLQIAYLIKGWAPAEGLRKTIWALVRRAGFGFTPREATALARLAAFDAYMNLKEDGWPEDTPIQQWRKSLWQEEAGAC